MPNTDYLNLWAQGSLGKTISHFYWNDSLEAIDRLGQSIWQARLQGPISGWTLPAESGISEIRQGYGFVGPVLCRTVASATISGLQAGTNYVHLVTTPSSGWAGGVAAKARTTSAALTNADGVTKGVILGTVGWAANTGVQSGSADSSLRQNAFPLRSHRQGVTLSLTAGPTTLVSGAYGWSTAVRFPTVSAQVSVAASQFLRWDTLTQSGGTFYLYNASSNAGTTYTGTLTLDGLLRVF